MTDPERDHPTNMEELGQEFTGALALFAVILAAIALAWEITKVM